MLPRKILGYFLCILLNKEKKHDWSYSACEFDTNMQWFQGVYAKGTMTGVG